MLRTIVLVGLTAVLFAAIPLIYERDPAGVQEALRRVVAGQPAPARQAAPENAAAGRQRSAAGRTVRVPADQRGHYRAEFRLNGRPVEALVDTGATLVALNRSTARRIGLSPAASQFRYRVETANGHAMAAAVTIDRLRIGRIDMRDVPAVVLDDAALGGTLVGLSFLNRLRRFGVEQGTLVMEQ